MTRRASRQSVVLPAPEGADTTKSVPRRPRRAPPRLLKILYLLADLLHPALGRTSRDELVERAAERLGQQRPRRGGLDRFRVLQAHDAGLLEQPGEVRRAVEAELHGERAGARDVLARQGGVDLDPLRGGAGQR